MAASTHHQDYRLLLRLLKETRQKASIAQTELAARLDTTQTFISKVERGERRLDLIELVEIFEALSIAPEAWIKDFLQHRKAEHKQHRVTRKISK
jgi:transcriptional regulator with XRE-family HTH domain